MRNLKETYQYAIILCSLFLFSCISPSSNKKSVIEEKYPDITDEFFTQFKDTIVTTGEVFKSEHFNYEMIIPENYKITNSITSHIDLKLVDKQGNSISVNISDKTPEEAEMNAHDLSKEIFEQMYSQNNAKLLEAKKIYLSNEKAFYTVFINKLTKQKAISVTIYKGKDVYLLTATSKIENYESSKLSFLTSFCNFKFIDENDKVKSQKPKEHLKNMTVFSSHFLAAPEKYKYEGENTNNSLQLKYKNTSQNIIYYLTSSKLPADAVIGYYLKSYKTEMINSGMLVKDEQFQGLGALLGKMHIQNSYLYQLHFISKGKGQTIQMVSTKPSDKEFEIYMNEIKIIN